MKTSCISHPENERLVIIRKWQEEFCEGNVCAAALLSYFEYWHNWKLNSDEYNKKLNRVSEMHNEKGILSEEVLQYHTLQEIADGILNIYGNKAISEALRFLESKNVISVHSNPNPRYYYDKTKYFQFYPDVCNDWLKSSYKSRPSKNASSITQKDDIDSAKMPDASGKNAALITEINNKEKNHPINARARNSFSSNLPHQNEEGSRAVIQPVIDALTAKGFPLDRFQYPDVEATIVHLLRAGATVEHFKRAYDIAASATKNKSFGVRYLIKAVESLLASHENHRAIINTRPSLGRVTKQDTYESDFTKGLHWMSDLVVEEIENEHH